MKQAGSNPGDAAVSQPQPSHVVHAGPNLEHMDVEKPKLPTEDQVRLEEPASSAGTLSSLQNLDKEFSFTNQFLEENPLEIALEIARIDMKESLHHRMWNPTPNKAHERSTRVYEALEKQGRDHTDQLLTNLAEAQKKKKKRHDSLKTPPWSPPHQPPPPLPPAGPSRTLGTSGAIGSSQLPTSPPPPSTN
ncbi:hypothetical protein Tco_0228265 [Tanacetum coccineum]